MQAESGLQRFCFFSTVENPGLGVNISDGIILCNKR